MGLELDRTSDSGHTSNYWKIMQPVLVDTEQETAHINIAVFKTKADRDDGANFAEHPRQYLLQGFTKAALEVEGMNPTKLAYEKVRAHDDFDGYTNIIE